jgi:hypothetical protein
MDNYFDIAIFEGMNEKSDFDMELVDRPTIV